MRALLLSTRTNRSKDPHDPSYQKSVVWITPRSVGYNKHCCIRAKYHYRTNMANWLDAVHGA